MKKLVVMMVLCVLWSSQSPAVEQLQKKAPEIKGEQWFNIGERSKLSMKLLRGKVVLVFFWTLNDPHCEKSLLILNNWYATSQKDGLEIIGVHSHEWTSETLKVSLSKKLADDGIRFPVVTDDSSQVWRAYEPRSWPSFYLIDKAGYIRAKYNGIFSWQSMARMIEILLQEETS